MIRIGLLCMVAALAAGCVAERHSVRRAGLVPHQTPSVRTGQPMEAPAALAAAVTTVAAPWAPAEGDRNAGVYLPRVQGQVAVRVRPTTNLDLALVHERASASGARAVSDDQPAIDATDASGWGWALHYSMPHDSPRFRLGLELGALVYRIPYVEYRTCVSDCVEEGHSTVERGEGFAPVWSAALIPSYRSGPLTVFGSVTARNHPTVVRGAIEPSYSWDDGVRGGPTNVTVAGGAEYAAASGVRAALLVYQVAASAPVRYAPTVAVALTLPIGPRDRAAPANR